jgi:hypothetical protein
MRNNLPLNLIYHYENVQAGDVVNGVYKIIYFFSDAGHIDRNSLQALYKEVSGGSSSIDLSFANLDILGEFAIKACSDLKAPEVFVLSVQDYNTGMESVRDLRNFRELFRRFGNCLSTPGNPYDKQGKFSSLFSKK